VRKYKILFCSLLVICTVIVSIFTNRILAEPEQETELTCQINKECRKTGLWAENVIGNREEVYYKNGLRDGIYRSYNNKGKLLFFGEYTKGIQTGTWYSFNENDFLVSKEKILGKNNDLTIKGLDGKRIKKNTNLI